MSQHWLRHAILSSAVIGSVHATAHAQAWVPEQGALGISLDYNFSTSDKVVTDTTFSFEDAGTDGHQITLGAEYVLVDKLAISASLPLVMLKYTGGIYSHEPTGGSYDDGDLHTTLTDLRAGVRYQLLDEPLAIAPHVAFTLPVADYETIGNTVAGRHLKQLHLGVSAGYLLGVATYLHATYEFTLAEKYDRGANTSDYSQNHSDLSFALGTKVLDYKLDLHIGANARFTHGGIGMLDAFPVQGQAPTTLPRNVIDYHDAVLDEDIVLVGAGVGYDISDKLTVTLDFRYFLEELSQNTLNASVLALGFNWSPL